MQKRFKVLIVHGTFSLGGAERQSLYLAPYLQQALGAEVKYIAFGGKERVATLCEEMGIAWESFFMNWGRGWLRRIYRLFKFCLKLRAEKPDLLLPYTTLPNIICGLLWRLTPAKLCVWNQRDGGLLRDNRLLEFLATHLVPSFISNSRHGATFLSQTLGVPSNRISVIPNGIVIHKPKKSRAEWRHQLKLGSDCIAACMVANLHHLKDHETLMRAWSIVCKRLVHRSNQAMLLLAGRFGSTYNKLETLRRELNLMEDIRFLGQVEDVPGLLNAVDIGVFSSRAEGLPNGVLECMAAGLPVVATDHQGIREAVGEKGFQFLVHPDDPQDLADRIAILIRNPELRRITGEQNRQRIEKHFSIEKMLEATVATFKKALPPNQIQNFHLPLHQ